MVEEMAWAIGTDRVRSNGADANADAAALARLARGDPSGLEAIFAAHHRPVYRLACRLLGSPEDAADVAQETFLRLLHAAKRSHKVSNLRAWLLCVAQNLCRDHLRRRERTGRPERHIDLIRAENGSAQTEQLALRQALERLPLTHAAAVVLRFYVCLSYREIAQVQGISEGTARSRVCRGLRRLRRLLADADPGGLAGEEARRR